MKAKNSRFAYLQINKCVYMYVCVYVFNGHMKYTLMDAERALKLHIFPQNVSL